MGATKSRMLPVPGADLDGVCLAMDFLTQQNKVGAGDDLSSLGIEQISAAGKHVIVIGGGDTGSDCIGTSNRHGAKSVTNFELLPKPPEGRPDYQPWPYWPMRLRTSSSHQEGVSRTWSVMTKQLVGVNGKVSKLSTVDVAFSSPDAPGGRPKMEEVPGTEKDWPADLVILALGFVGPDPDTIIKDLGVELDARGNIKTARGVYATSVDGVFSAGDCRRGQSLIVWAISEGREAAREVDEYLIGESELPTKGALSDDLPLIPFQVG